MCTAIKIYSDNGDIYFGRTMDFSFELNPELYYIPAKYQWRNVLNTHDIENKYNILGIGQDVSVVNKLLKEGVRAVRNLAKKYKKDIKVALHYTLIKDAEEIGRASCRERV